MSVPVTVVMSLEQVGQACYEWLLSQGAIKPYKHGYHFQFPPTLAPFEARYTCIDTPGEPPPPVPWLVPPPGARFYYTLDKE